MAQSPSTSCFNLYLFKINVLNSVKVDMVKKFALVYVNTGRDVVVHSTVLFKNAQLPVIITNFWAKGLFI